MYACDCGIMVTKGHGALRELKLKPTGFISLYSTPDFKIWTRERAALLDRCESRLKKLLQYLFQQLTSEVSGRRQQEGRDAELEAGLINEALP